MLPILGQVLLGHDFIRPLYFGSSAPVHPQIMPPCAQAPSPNVAYLSPPQAIGPTRGWNEPPTTVVGKHSTHSHDTGKPEENAAQLVALNEKTAPKPSAKTGRKSGQPDCTGKSRRFKPHVAIDLKSLLFGLASARLINQGGFATLTKLTAPRLDRRFAGHTVFNHDIPHG